MSDVQEATLLSRARRIAAVCRLRHGAVLDIGAGMGHLVYGFRSLGLSAEGVEPSSSGRHAARQRYGLALHPTVQSEWAGRFDLITLVHSLEHVPDPVATLSEATALLGPSGTVYIEVPHVGSVEMWRPRRSRMILDLPYHLYHFVPDTLRKVVERAGLRVVDVRLRNADVLEWAFRVRARFKRPTMTTPCVDGGEASESATASTRSDFANSLWPSNTLPRIRRRFPGWAFDVTAVRP